MLLLRGAGRTACAARKVALCRPRLSRYSNMRRATAVVSGMMQGLEWDEGWKIVTGTFAYTNHTVLPEALEVWSVDLMQALLPRYASVGRCNSARPCPGPERWIPVGLVGA